MALISRSIFWVEARMKPIASGRSGLGIADFVGEQLGRFLSALVDQLAERLVGGFELGGEAEDVDQRRAQIVADDVGEALDFFIGALEVGGAPLDFAFEVGVEDEQPIAGLAPDRRCSATPRRR